MQIELVSVTPDAEKVIERAARTCYQSGALIADDSCKSFLPKLISMGHLTPFEHSYATFMISGVSRAMTHQLVRHRMMAVCQKSQRYVTENNFEYVMPPSVKQADIAEFKNDMESIRKMYLKWKKKGLRNEDARFVLPNACESEIMISANFREFRHIFQMRCSKHAQWEIREACSIMLRKLHAIAPEVFADQISLADQA